MYTLSGSAREKNNAAGRDFLSVSIHPLPIEAPLGTFKERGQLQNTHRFLMLACFFLSSILLCEVEREGGRCIAEPMGAFVCTGPSHRWVRCPGLSRLRGFLPRFQ